MAVRRRERPWSWYRVEDNYVPTAVIMGLILVVGSFIAYFGFLIASDVHNNDVERHNIIATMLQPAGVAEGDLSETAVNARRDRAMEIRDAARTLEYDSENYFHDFSEGENSRIVSVAAYGKPMQIRTDTWDQGEYLFFLYLWPGLPIILLVFTTVLFLAYAEMVLRKENRIDAAYGSGYAFADLPWREVWPAFLTLSFGPIGWICMAVSAIRLKRIPEPAEQNATNVRPPVVIQDEPDDPFADHRNRVAALIAREQNQQRTLTFEEQVALARRLAGQNQPEEAEDPRADVVRETIPPGAYVSSPGVARRTYVELRDGQFERKRREGLDRVISSLAQTDDSIRLYSEELRRYHTRRNELRSEKERTEAALAEMDTTSNISHFNEEFDRLLALPGMLAVQVVNGGLRLIVRSTIRYHGHEYDGGDWQIDIVPSITNIYAYELRRGVKSSWSGRYPVYRLGGGSFCFGSREAIIDEHLWKGQYLEGIALAVECLSQVNEEDQSRIPEAFNRVEEPEMV